MSLTATKAVWAHSSQSGTALLVMLALADHADANMVAWPSAATLAAMARTTDRHARRILKDLVAAGEIEPVGTGSRGVVKYRLTFDTHVRGEAPPTPDTDVRGEDHQPLTPMSGDAGVTPDTHVTPRLTPTSGDPLTPMSPEPSGNRQRTVGGGGDARAREGGPLVQSGDPNADVAAITDQARAILRHWNAEVTRLWGGDPSPRSSTNALEVAKGWVREGVPLDLALNVITKGLERKREGGQGPPGSPAYVRHSMADALTLRNSPETRGQQHATKRRAPQHQQQDPHAADVDAQRRAARRARLGLASRPDDVEAARTPAGDGDAGRAFDGHCVRVR